MKINILLCIVLSVALSVPTDAQFQRPGYGPEQTKLAFLAGTYTTLVHIPAGPAAPNGADGKGTLNVQWGLDSLFLIIDDQSMNELLGNYKGHGLLGFDRHDAKYVLSMFNNFGDTPQYRGSFSGDTLILTTKVEFSKGSFDQKLVWYKDHGILRLKVYNDIGKGSMLTMEEISTPTADVKK